MSQRTQEISLSKVVTGKPLKKKLGPRSFFGVKFALRVVIDYQVETLGSAVSLRRLPEIRYCECVSCAGPCVHLPGKMCGWVSGNFSKVRKPRMGSV